MDRHIKHLEHLNPPPFETASPRRKAHHMNDFVGKVPSVQYEYGWCKGCGCAYEGVEQPACECAGDPPVPPGRLDPMHGAYELRAYRERVRNLRHAPH